MFLKNMKRRNPELTKNRKCPKRSKYGDGSLGVSIFLAAKLLVMWIVIVAMDFATGFRLEYMYPCWLMVQSVIDAYKYQGVGFTVFFISMVVTSDILVYMFVPTTAMFFLASLYVWIQLMMHSGVERGICVQTVVIWMVFLYLEATMRLRELKLDSSSSYFTWDICRPFAAHCVGYPLVTFSFSVKSFIGFKYRKHKQSQIAVENRLFRDLINDALPEENRRPLPEVTQTLDAKSISATKSGSDSNGFTSLEHPIPANGAAANASNHQNPHSNGGAGGSSSQSHSESRAQQKRPKNQPRPFLSDMLVSLTSPKPADDQVSQSSSSSAASSVADSESQEAVDVFTTRQVKKNLNLEIENCDIESVESEKAYRLNVTGLARNSKANRSNSPSVTKGASNLQQNNFEKESVSGNPGKKQKGLLSRETGAESAKPDDLYCAKLEGEAKRLKTDLAVSRQETQDQRSQLANLHSQEKSSRLELQKLQQDNESLQQRLNNLVAARQQDKSSAALIEKRLMEEKKARLSVETQLQTERKQRKAMEDAVPECSATCKSQRREMDTELRQLRRDLANKDEKMRNQGEEIHSMKQRQESTKESDMMSSALSSLQDKNAHLEMSLGQETKLKLDLFSALGEAKRQLEISQNITTQRDKEISELKQKMSRLAEVMTLLPSNSNPANKDTISALVADLKQQGTIGSHRGLSSPDNHIGYN